MKKSLLIVAVSVILTSSSFLRAVQDPMITIENKTDRVIGNLRLKMYFSTGDKASMKFADIKPDTSFKTTLVFKKKDSEEGERELGKIKKIRVDLKDQCQIKEHPRSKHGRCKFHFDTARTKDFSCGKLPKIITIKTRKPTEKELNKQKKYSATVHDQVVVIKVKFGLFPL